MAISVDWATLIISIPQSYLDFVAGDLYELDTEKFRDDLRAESASVDGMPFDDIYQSTSIVTLSGVTYARFFEIINGYTITFEDGNYAVNLVGTNNNILDVTNRNMVGVASQNSAGLIIAGSGVTTADKKDIANLTRDVVLSTETQAAGAPGSIRDYSPDAT